MTGKILVTVADLVGSPAPEVRFEGYSAKFVPVYVLYRVANDPCETAERQQVARAEIVSRIEQSTQAAIAVLNNIGNS